MSILGRGSISGTKVTYSSLALCQLVSQTRYCRPNLGGLQPPDLAAAITALVTSGSEWRSASHTSAAVAGKWQPHLFGLPLAGPLAL